MKTPIILLLLILLSLLLQQSLPAWPLFAGLKPPLTLALVVHLAFRLSPRMAWLSTSGVALLYDSLEPGPFGPALLAFPLITYFILRHRRNLFADGIITQLFCGACAGTLTVLSAGIIYLVTNARPIHSLTSMIVGGLLLGAFTQLIFSQLMLKCSWISIKGGRS